MAVEHFTPDIDGDENLVQIAALTPTDNAVIIGNGSAWTAESGGTLRTSLGLAIGTDVQAYDADLAQWAGVNPSSYLTTAAAAAAYQPLDADLISWAAVPRASGFDTFAGTPTSANLRALLSDESGSGALLFAGGALGAPASGTLTSCTGLPISTGVSGLGTGIATFLATPSSENLIAAITDETGTGSLVFATSPTITTPRIVGVANNSSATAGDVAEYLSGTRAAGSALSLTSDTALSVASVSLPPGDYEVSVKIFFTLGAATTVTSLISSVSATNNTLDTNLENFSNTRYPSGSILGNANDSSSFTGPVRVSINSTTTYYAVARASFGASTATAYGYIRARRVR